jgi:hypothetical protein
MPPADSADMPPDDSGDMPPGDSADMPPDPTDGDSAGMPADSATDPATDPASGSPADSSTPLGPVAKPAGTNAQPAVAAVPALPQAPLTPEQARQQQVALHVGDLLKMATDLKAEVDKTNQDELSVTVVRKANELEQYAHKLRLDPRQTATTKEGGQ